MNIILIYTGQVELVKGGLGAKYILETPVEGLEDAMVFKKRLLGYEIIGSKVECEVINGGKSVKALKVLVNEKAAPELITEWSVKQRGMLEARKLKKELKVKDSADIDSLIDAVKSTYLNHTERKAIALYIFNKLA